MSRRHALIVFIVALLLRGLYLAVMVDGPGMLQQPDTLAFTLPAAGLATQGIIGLPDETGAVPKPATERVPGYILFLALLRLAFGDGLWPPVIAQALLDALTCVLIGRLATRLRPGLGLGAGLLAAFAPNLIIHAGLVLSDSLFLLPFVLFLDAALGVLQAPSWRAAAAAGVWLGISTLVRPVTLYFLPVLPLLLAALAPRRRLAVAVAALLGGLLMVAPWAARNAAVAGHWQMGSQAGVHSLYWLVPLAREYGQGIALDTTKQEMDRKLAAHLAAKGLTAPPDNPFDAAAELSAVASQALRETGPVALARAWLVGAAINLGSTSLIAAPAVQRLERPSFYGTPGGNPTEKALNYLSQVRSLGFMAVIATGMAGLGALRLLAVAGLIRGWRRDWPRRAIILLAVTAAYILAVTGPITGVKYRLPLEPLLIILTAEGIAALAGRLRRTRHGSRT